MSTTAIKNRITKAFQKHLHISQSDAAGLTPKGSASGKVYEAFVLSLILKNLARHEQCTFSIGAAWKWWPV